MMQIERQREDYYRKLGTPPGVPTMKGATAEPENTHESYNTIIKELGDHSVPDGWIQRPKRNAVPGTPPGPPVQWDKAEDPDDVQPGYGYVPADTAREDIFYYHTDHLGSTSYITDAKANVAQFDAYLPYGELLVDEHSSTEEMPYKFNGKEFDEETGLYYYGARYMNPRTSLWYGVDPLAEKYVQNSPYCYGANNPVKFIDTDGRKLRFAPGTSTAFKLKFRAAIQYLHEHKVDGIIAQIEKSSTIIYIAERSGESSAFNSGEKTIYWDPNMGLMTSSDKMLSPAAVLNHEADHTLQYLQNPDKYTLDFHTQDPNYGNKEEARAITGAEQRTASALSEINDGEVTRTDHFGILYTTKSVMTTEAKDGKKPNNPFSLGEVVVPASYPKNVKSTNDNNDNKKIMNRIKFIAVFGIWLLGFNTLEACNMKFKIIYANACLSTIISITPDFFDKGMIEGSLDSVMVVSHAECVEFMDVISSLKETKVKEGERLPEIDVRAKVIVFLNDQFWDSYYWGMFYLYHNGKIYEVNKEFRDRVNLMLKKGGKPKMF